MTARRGAYDDTPVEKGGWEGLRDLTAQLEQRYCYDKGDDADLSTLAWISRNQDALAAEYMLWFQVNKLWEEKWWEGIQRWEEKRFGAQLHASAHGVLAFAIRRYANPKSAERKRKPPLKRPEGLTQEERRARMLDALSSLVDRKTMPTATTSAPEPEREPGEDHETDDEEAAFAEAEARR